jgi:glutamate--cysteine ligase
MAALCAGLFYDAEASSAAWDAVSGFTAEDRQHFRDRAPREGLRASAGGRSLLDLARDILPLARDGLARRRRLDASGEDERRYLDPLEEIAATGKNLAERRLELFHGAWGGDIKAAFSNCVY